MYEKSIITASEARKAANKNLETAIKMQLDLVDSTIRSIVDSPSFSPIYFCDVNVELCFEVIKILKELGYTIVQKPGRCTISWKEA